MIDFELTEDQKLMQKSVRDFCQKELRPLIAKMEEEKKIPEEIINGLSDQGLLAMTVSPDYGGVNAQPVTVGIMAEEIARIDLSCAIPTFFLVEAAWGYIFNKYGTKKAKRDILPLVTKGKTFLGIAVTEPDAGSDVASIKTMAKKSHHKFIINGEKMYISGMKEVMDQFPEGGGHLTLAKTDKAKGARGMSLFYIPLKNGKGIRPSFIEEWGRKGISMGGFSLENIEIPDEYLIGEENRGFYIVMEGFDYARAIISVVCCGVAMSALEKAMEYLLLRRAFGQPLARFQGIQFKLSEHWARLDAIRLLGYKALWMYGKEQEGQSYDRFQVTRLCAEAKMLAPAFAFEAINEAIQWFGAFGYTKDCPLEKALKGVRSYYWAEGTLEMMKIIVARELLGREAILSSPDKSDP